VLVQDVISPPRGDGLAVGPGSSVTVKYVLRRSNGYLIYASYGGLGGRDEDFVFRMGQGNAVPGFEKALLGLAAGSRRRFVLPAALGYAPGGTRPGKSPGPLPPDWGSRRSIDSHCREPLLFEVLVSRVRP
jgi:FKBP-type peptidyl-prolyl cis-trans isomerase